MLGQRVPRVPKPGTGLSTGNFHTGSEQGFAKTGTRRDAIRHYPHTRTRPIGGTGILVPLVPTRPLSVLNT